MRLHGSRLVRRDWWLRHAPTALVEYPFETLMSIFGVVAGLPLLLNVAHPASINDLLPDPLVMLWAGSMVVGGVSIGVGLWQHWFRLVASSLYLLGAVCAIYALGLFSYIGPLNAIPSGPVFTVVAALCFLRGAWLRERDRILAAVREAAR